MVEDKISSDHIVVGFRQSKRLLEECAVQKAIVARDADQHIMTPLLDLCRQQNVDVVYVDTKRELGKFCRLDVDAAVAVVTKDA